jgi:hypothetical protein
MDSEIDKLIQFISIKELLQQWKGYIIVPVYVKGDKTERKIVNMFHNTYLSLSVLSLHIDEIIRNIN